METIRNYLESMFAQLPNTVDVQKAKEELGQMMEDKYTELLAEGHTENEAIGIVISEFGNLQELAEDLGIQRVVQQDTTPSGRVLTREEVRDYLSMRTHNSFLRSLGVFLCIISPSAFILAEISRQLLSTSENIPMAIALTVFFFCIGAAIALFIYASTRDEGWRSLQEENCSIDFATAEELHAQRESIRMRSATQRIIGILLCAFCFLPVAVIGILLEGKFEEIAIRPGADTIEEVGMMAGTVLLFFLVGIGVFLILHANGKTTAYDTLLRLNDRITVGGNYVPSQQEERYSNETVQRLMEVFHPTVLCIYLCWSFLTFDWHITWIIWPIAALVRHWIKAVWGEKEELQA